jgi:hypothetical protein
MKLNWDNYTNKQYNLYRPKRSKINLSKIFPRIKHIVCSLLYCLTLITGHSVIDVSEMTRHSILYKLLLLLLLQLIISTSIICFGWFLFYLPFYWGSVWSLEIEADQRRNISNMNHSPFDELLSPAISSPFFKKKAGCRLPCVCSNIWLLNYSLNWLQ